MFVCSLPGSSIPQRVGFLGLKLDKLDHYGEAAVKCEWEKLKTPRIPVYSTPASDSPGDLDASEAVTICLPRFPPKGQEGTCAYPHKTWLET